jgi:hypothetical protein
MANGIIIEIRKRRIVVKNLALKLVIKIIIEIESLFKRIKTATIEIVRNIRNV